MAETIQSIREVTSVHLPEKKYGTYDGYEIVTDDQTVLVLIYNGQSCCENWGYMSSEDNLAEFVGADLLSVELTDTALKTWQLDGYPLDVGAAQFVNVNTSKGLLQFVVYNEHNGYYGHDIVVRSAQLNHKGYL
jgi:hypothetical protein